MDQVINEIAHNLTGYVLLFLAVLLMVCGMKFRLQGLVDTGRELMDAALLGLQVKRVVQAAQKPA